MGSEVGGLVGYSVRFDEKTSAQTRIKFLTDGMLVRECMLFPKLEKYKVVILDEAHERSIHTDILCALLRDIQRKYRPDLKILIMSATLDADTFQKYFEAQVMYVQGRQFPVSVFYCEKAEQSYVDATVATILQIHLTESPNGDILTFLTGREEIESVTKLLRERVKLFPPNAGNLLVCPLYAAQTNEQQKLVFQMTPAGSRKVVIATNIAETSLTVPNIKFVVDCGLVKMRLRAPRNGQTGQNRGAEVNILGVVPISQEQAWQRAGRAGRTQPGKCFRLYPETAFLELPRTQLPEIQRIELTSLVLQLMVIGITDVVNFPYMSPPDRTAIRHALEQLYVLGALDSHRRITELGRQMALFPLDPAVAKVLIRSKDAGVCEEVITIVAMMSVENLFYNPSHKENGTASTSSSNRDRGDEKSHEEVDMAKKTFAAEEGDHLFYLNVYNGYQEADEKRQWCKEHFVNRRSLEKALDVREQLVDYWENSAKWMLTSDPTLSTEDRIDNIRKTFLGGFFENVAILLPNGHYQNLRDRQEVAIHPSSILAGRKPPCVLYRELVLTSRFYMRDVLAIEQHWLIELAPHSYKLTVDSTLAPHHAVVTGGGFSRNGTPRSPGNAREAQASIPSPTRVNFGFNLNNARPALII